MERLFGAGIISGKMLNNSQECLTVRVISVALGRAFCKVERAR